MLSAPFPILRTLNMAETLHISTGASRSAQYTQLLPQLEALVAPEPSLIANLANVTAALRQTFGFFWVGFYLVDGNELVLGPFQGDMACTRIGFGNGVCGTSWKEQKTLLVPNVDEFPGHIACSAASRSEVVVPIFHDGKVSAVLDVDSDEPDHFTEDDATGLERVAALLGRKFR